MSASWTSGREVAFTRDDTLTVQHRDQLERGFRKLSPEQRAVLVLHHYVGLTLSEVAERLEIPEGTAKSRLH
jgi:RNA polymerase sigma-70 factor (ECF subfamily)